MEAQPERVLDGFPYEVLPTGWFQVAWSDAVAAGDVVPLRYFGLDLVLYRSEAGAAVVLDANCPHMGAHLGYGGRVSGEEIVCPFHGWQWAPDGRNTLVPSDGAPTNRRKLRCWEVAETNGILWVWYDHAGRAPLWEPLAERRGDRDFVSVYPGCVHRWEGLHARPQYMIENVVDLDHFPSVHFNHSKPEVVEIRDLGPVISIDMKTVHGYGKARTWLTPDGPVETVMTTDCYGMSTIFSDWGPGSDGSYLITNMTPIDGSHLDIFMTVLVPQDPDFQDLDMPQGRALRRVGQQRTQTERDVPIWEHLVYVARPPYSRNEGKFMVEIKRWASRFYEPDELDRAVASTDGDPNSGAVTAATGL